MRQLADVAIAIDDLRVVRGGRDVIPRGRHAPAAAIIAALSVLSRGEATLTLARPASRSRIAATSAPLQEHAVLTAIHSG